MSLMSSASVSRSDRQAPHVAVPSFEDTAGTILRELQSALAELVSSLPGEVSRAVDLQQGLGLDKKLGWQLFKFVKASDPVAEVAHVPGGPSIRRILSAASRRRIPRSITERVSIAFECFETFVNEHGGDRAEVISLASGIAASGAREQSYDLRVRKNVFKGLSHLWGIKAETVVQTAVYYREGNLVVGGLVGVQRLRPGVPLTLAMAVGNSNDSANKRTSAETASPFGPSISAQGRAIRGMQLLPEFSSQPLPEMIPHIDRDGRVETEILFPPSGRAGAVTLYTGQMAVNNEKHSSSKFGMGTVVGTPVVTLISEMLIEQGLTDPASAQAAIYGRRGAFERVGERRTADLLPQRESLMYLGVMKNCPPVPGAPQHTQAIRQSIERAGWVDARFDVYRCIVEYPLLHTMLSLAVDAIKSA